MPNRTNSVVPGAIIKMVGVSAGYGFSGMCMSEVIVCMRPECLAAAWLWAARNVRSDRFVDRPTLSPSLAARSSAHNTHSTRRALAGSRHPVPRAIQPHPAGDIRDIDTFKQAVLRAVH